MNMVEQAQPNQAESCCRGIAVWASYQRAKAMNLDILPLAITRMAGPQII
jgi:hypothetical protein